MTPRTDFHCITTRFKLPQGTPNAAIRGDTGCLRIEHIIHKKQLLYMMKIKTAGDERWVKQIGMHQDKYYTYGPNIITRMNNLCNQYNISKSHTTSQFTSYPS